MLDHAAVDALVDNITSKLDTFAIRYEGHHVDWRALFESHRASLKLCDSELTLEERINGILARAGLSHAAFFSHSGRAVPAHLAIAATLRRFDVNGEPRWIFQDVHAGGPAAEAGVKPGDVLLAIGGREPDAYEKPKFAFGTNHVLTLDSPAEGRREVVIKLAEAAVNPSSGTPPMVAPTGVTARPLDDDIGYVHVAFFAGASGRRFALALDSALATLGQRPRLIIDLRGACGGFVGALRLMSHLTPDRRPVGYSLTRLGQNRGLKREQLMRLRRIPNTRLGEIGMYVRFNYFNKDRSVSLWTEGLGRKPYHGRIVMLTNEHSFSAAEMVAAFASEEELAVLVGTKTGGQSLGASNHTVADGYTLRLPATIWHTWRGSTYEGKGISPDVEIEQSLDDVRARVDTQLEHAKAVVKGL